MMDDSPRGVERLAGAAEISGPTTKKEEQAGGTADYFARGISAIGIYFRKYLDTPRPCSLLHLYRFYFFYLFSFDILISSDVIILRKKERAPC